MNTLKVINNFLRTDSQKQTFKIVRPLGGGSYEVKDNNGVTLVVDSAIKWDVGSSVKVKDLVIVGTSGEESSDGVYEV